MTEVRLLSPHESVLLGTALPGVFGGTVDPARAAAFLSSPAHYLAAALDGGAVVGFASAVTQLHPDKPPELYVSEVGVTPAYRGQGLGTRLMELLVAHARTHGCAAVWTLTEADNAPARRLYAAAGGLEEGVRIFVVPLEETGDG